MLELVSMSFSKVLSGQRSCFILFAGKKTFDDIGWNEGCA